MTSASANFSSRAAHWRMFIFDPALPKRPRFPATESSPRHLPCRHRRPDPEPQRLRSRRALDALRAELIRRRDLIFGSRRDEESASKGFKSSFYYSSTGLRELKRASAFKKGIAASIRSTEVCGRWRLPRCLRRWRRIDSREAQRRAGKPRTENRCHSTNAKHTVRFLRSPYLTNPYAVFCV